MQKQELEHIVHIVARFRLTYKLYEFFIYVNFESIIFIPCVMCACCALIVFDCQDLVKKHRRNTTLTTLRPKLGLFRPRGAAALR